MGFDPAACLNFEPDVRDEGNIDVYYLDAEGRAAGLRQPAEEAQPDRRHTCSPRCSAKSIKRSAPQLLVQQYAMFLFVSTGSVAYTHCGSGWCHLDTFRSRGS